MIDFEVSYSTTSAIRGRLPGESSCGPAGSVHRLGNVHSVDIVIEVMLNEGNRHGATKIKLQQVPKFLVNAFDFISSRGLDQEGLFRREGNASRLNQNNWAVYIGSAPIPANFSVHDVCTMVKRFFRDLKEPLLAGPDLRNRLFEMVNKNQIAPLSRQEFAAVFEPEVNFTKKNVTFCLSRAQLGTLGYLMRQLHRISHNSAKHQMTSHNLATVFAPTLFRDEIAKDKARRKDRRGSQDNILISAREDTQVRIEAVQLLIEHANWIGLHPNCYLTSGHPRSSSAVPSPRQPPFVNMANLKQSCFVDRKYSMKERAREPSKALGERRASSTFRFITDRFLPRRSPSRDRGSVTDGGLANRRASSPALIAADNCHVKDRIAVRHDRKTPSRHMLEFAGSHTDITQPVENYNCRCRDALRSHGTRSSRARQHHSHSTTHTQQRLCGKPITQAVSCQPAGKVVCSTAETGIASSITRRDSGKKRRESPPVRASKVLKDTPMSLVSHEHFLSSYGEGQERSRRRHTTPVKTCTALRRNQPNTLHSGLRHPKRRATVVNASEQEKENRVGRVEASDSVSSSCEDFESTLNVDESSSMLTDASADLLAQKGQESRSRRVRRQQRRESLALQRSLLDSSRIESSAVFAKDYAKDGRLMISTACSPIVFPSTPSSESKEYQQAHGSAVVGETIVVTMAPVLSSPTNEASTVCLPTDLNKTPPRSTLTPSTPHSSGFHSIAQPLSRLSADASRSITYTSTALHLTVGTCDPHSPIEDHSKCILPVRGSSAGTTQEEGTFADANFHITKGGCAGMEKQRLLSSRLSSKPFSSHSALSRSTSSEYPPSNDGSNVGLASDDDMFAASKEMKAVILNATSEADINVHMDRRLRFRPSVALIEKQGIVRERVNQFRRLGNFVPMETISGRSSGLSSRSSIDAGSLTGDDDFIKPSAPPVTHSLNMGGTRRNSATPITSSVSQLSSTHPPPI